MQLRAFKSVLVPNQNLKAMIHYWKEVAVRGAITNISY